MGWKPSTYYSMAVDAASGLATSVPTGAGIGKINPVSVLSRYPLVNKNVSGSHANVFTPMGEKVSTRSAADLKNNAFGIYLSKTAQKGIKSVDIR